MKKSPNPFDAIYHIITSEEVPHEEFLYSYENPETILLQKEKFTSLGKKATHVLNLVLDTPADVLDSIFSKKLQRISATKLAKYLKSVGWKGSEIDRSFQEIRRNLC